MTTTRADAVPSELAVPPPDTTAVSVTITNLVTLRVDAEAAEARSIGGFVAVDLESNGEDELKACRICHLSPDRTMGKAGNELIFLGCCCKNELGTAHLRCAETWFRLKGNRFCEICGANVKNITGNEDGSFIEEWHENRAPSTGVGGGGHRNTTERVSCWRGQPFCNFLMACLVIAFILPWFFRVNMF